MINALIDNIIKVTFTKNMSCFDEINEYEYTFDVSEKDLSVAYLHTTNSVIERGNYETAPQSSKEFLANLFSNGNLLTWNKDMWGEPMNDAGGWRISIYLNYPKKLYIFCDPHVWEQSICQEETNNNMGGIEYLKLACRDNFHSPMIKNLHNTYLWKYVNKVPEKITVEKIYDPWGEIFGLI